MPASDFIHLKIEIMKKNSAVRFGALLSDISIMSKVFPVNLFEKCQICDFAFLELRLSMTNCVIFGLGGDFVAAFMSCSR